MQLHQIRRCACWFALSATAPLLWAQDFRRNDVSLAAAQVRPATKASVAPVKVTMAAAAATPQLNAYTVGNGDVLAILVWHEKDLSPTVTVRPDGRITVPLIGELEVAGLSPLQIQVLLHDRLTSLMVDPRVNVTVTEIHSRMVYITGEVTRPGAYPLTSSITSLQLIAMAGGLTWFASHKNLKIIRPGSTTAVAVFDYKHLLDPKDSTRNILLRPGDTVVVP